MFATFAKSVATIASEHAAGAELIILIVFGRGADAEELAGPLDDTERDQRGPTSCRDQGELPSGNSYQR